ncbi:hypothetical protein LJC64_00570 [Ruminococcaceae bacterium OttesenSCG-928-A11]|nr:hypothetical protein [Ruminococcaceae bacterium OttesenSCG-928-A11]
MAVARMKYLNVYGPEKYLRQTLGEIARSGLFAPEAGEAIHSAIRYGSNKIDPLLTKAKGLLKDLGQSSLAGDYTGPADAYTLDAAADYLEKFAAEVARRGKRKTAIESELEIQVKTDGLLSHMTDLDVNIEDLFTVETLKVRVGRLPKESYVRLAYYADKGFNFTSYFNFIVYDFDGEYYWGLYFAPQDSSKDIDDIFKSLYFERIWVPDFVQGRPEEALKVIRQREVELREELATIVTNAGIASEEELAKIKDVTAWLSMMDQLYEMKKYALVFNHTFYISGFVPEDSYADFEKLIGGVKSVKIKEAAQKQEVPAKPPVKLKNGWFSRPYQMYTEMYGLPNYNDIDPTGIVAWIYSVLYGVMFADLGQGLVLGLVGYFFMYRKKNMAIGLILARAAIFCCIFGFLFGSVFGYEHLLDPMWHAMGFHEKPFEVMGASSINLILLVSIAIGVVVVSLAILMNIISKFKRGKPGEAIAGVNGIAGLVFYLALVFLLVDSMMLNLGMAGGPVYIIFLIVIPLLVMYMQEPIAELIDTGKIHIESIPDLFLSSFFELFVAMLEFLSNTASFLRVGGFVLVHAGMMSVVMTLAEMFTGVGNIAVMIIGNIFVICLEGLLVGIQALRLNYYEVFSRFYEADGQPFEPLCLQPDTVEL